MNRRLPSFLVMIAMLGGFSSGRAQELSVSLQPIEKYLDSKTTLVAWFTPATVSRQDLQNVYTLLSGDSSQNDVEELLQTFNSMGIERVFVLSEDKRLSLDQFVIVVDSTQIDVVMDWAALNVPPGYSVKPKNERSALIGMPASVASVESKDGELSQDLRRSLERIHSDNGLTLRLDPEVDFIAAMRNGLASDIPMNTILDAIPKGAVLSSHGTIPIPVCISIDVQTAEDLQNFASIVRRMLSRKNETEPRIDLEVQEGVLTMSIKKNTDWKVLRDLLAGRAVQELQSMNQLRQLIVAIHNYESAHGTFPPQCLVDQAGNKLLSWRVLLLPYIGEAQLYDQFHLNESWDSPHNQTLIEKMPRLFRDAALTAEDHGGKTRFVVPLTATSIFGRPGKPMRFANITDGLSFTIALLEVDHDRSVVWTKPDDVVIGPEISVAALVDGDQPSILVVLADGSVHRLQRETPNELFHALIGATDGIMIHDNEWQRWRR